MPKLVNRGPAGLLTKVTGKRDYPKPKQPAKKLPINRITPALEGLVVDIDSLVPDPMNARLHPERNMEAITASLVRFGQLRPITVRKETRVVVAGNGTIAAAKRLGWTKIAATMVDLDGVSAISYGLADNRTAELALWDIELTGRLSRIEQEAGLDSIGWSMDELLVLRTTDWAPPTEPDTKPEKMLLKFTEEQWLVIQKVALKWRNESDNGDLELADCVTKVCQLWFED